MITCWGAKGLVNLAPDAIRSLSAGALRGHIRIRKNEIRKLRNEAKRLDDAAARLRSKSERYCARAEQLRDKAGALFEDVVTIEYLRKQGPD